jgi:predicted phage tail protein
MEIKANVDAVLIGRILAGIIIVFSFIYSVKAATEEFSGGFWAFLVLFITPLAIAFLIIMVTEVLRELRRRGAQNGS